MLVVVSIVGFESQTDFEDIQNDVYDDILLAIDPEMRPWLQNRELQVEVLLWNDWRSVLGLQMLVFVRIFYHPDCEVEMRLGFLGRNEDGQASCDSLEFPGKELSLTIVKFNGVGKALDAMCSFEQSSDFMFYATLYVSHVAMGLTDRAVNELRSEVQLQDVFRVPKLTFLFFREMINCIAAVVQCCLLDIWIIRSGDNAWCYISIRVVIASDAIHFDDGHRILLDGSTLREGMPLGHCHAFILETCLGACIQSSLILFHV